MKKTLLFFLTILLLFPVILNATSYGSAESTSKRYINNFLNPDRYIKVTKGALISKAEVEKTIVKKDLTVSSYMYDGTKFWAKDSYIIGETIEKKTSGDAKTKVTELVLHDTKVKGRGKYNDPWMFVDTYKVTVKSNGNGLIDNAPSATKKVSSFGSVSFTITPDSGFKYLNNTCNSIGTLSGSTFTISNVEKDIECIVSFESSRYSSTLPAPYSAPVHIQLTNTNKTYSFASPQPNTFASRYLNGYYTDDLLKTRIGKLTTLPYRDGWTFKGYYIKRSDYDKLYSIKATDDLLINQGGYFETTYELLKDNAKREIIGWQVEANKYKITFDKNGGSGGTNELNNIPYEHDLPSITVPGRPGYVFEGYYSTNPNGSFKDKYYNASGNEVKIFEMAKAGNLTLKARWTECGHGKYCPGDNVAHNCPNGYPNTETTTSTKCSDCRYWDPCHTGHNTCRYGCGTCGGDCYSCSCKTTCDYRPTEVECWTFCSTCCNPTYSCNCSSCYYGENTCKGAWIKNTTCTSGTTYTVNLNKNGGSGGTDSYTVTYYGGSNVKVNVDSISTPTRAGYVFEGYYTSTSGGTKIIDVTDRTSGFVSEPDVKSKQTPNGTTFTLYARWTPCSKGSYCPGDNTSTPCPTGQYQNETAKTTCKDCQAGTYSGQVGSETCAVCSPGEYQDKPKQSSCIKCPAGTYQNETGKTSCKNCVAEAYSEEGLDRCIACLNGKTSSAKSSSCNLTCSNSSNVLAWETATWNTNNTVSNACKIKTCKSGYKLENNKCVEDRKTQSFGTVKSGKSYAILKLGPNGKHGTLYCELKSLAGYSGIWTGGSPSAAIDVSIPEHADVNFYFTTGDNHGWHVQLKRDKTIFVTPYATYGYEAKEYTLGISPEEEANI